MKILCKLRWVILTSTIKMLLITKKAALCRSDFRTVLL